jgi:hypothetical protein
MLARVRQDRHARSTQNIMVTILQTFFKKRLSVLSAAAQGASKHKQGHVSTGSDKLQKHRQDEGL